MNMLTIASNLPSVRAGTIVVPDDYPTIQTAINAANEGDTVYVKAGVYFENIVIRKSLTLAGENSDTTAIDGNGAEYAILVKFDGYAHNVVIKGFTIQNSGTIEGLSAGIRLVYADHCNVSENRIAHNKNGIILQYGSNNTIIGNEIAGNSAVGVYLYSSARNLVSENDITGNQYGIGLDNSPNNAILKNNITNNDIGTYVYYQFSTGNEISGNNITENRDGVRLYLCWQNQISENQIVGNKDWAIELSAGGGVYPFYSLILRNNITGNVGGIRLAGSRNNLISENEIADSKMGIEIDFSSRNNTVSMNNIKNNSCGLDFEGDSNFIFSNNFVGNEIQVRSSGSNIWDRGYPSGGNYWSDYWGFDLKRGPNQDIPGSDLFGDTPFTINAHNKDNYPLFSYYGAVPVLPLARFSYSPESPVAAETNVDFDASNSSCPNGTIVGYRWSFGDGDYDSNEVASHVYDGYGEYRVELTVVSNTGAKNTASRRITIRQRPIAIFDSSTTPLLGEIVTLNASQSVPQGGSIADYIWDFGDGNVTSTVSPITTHVYSFPETFNVTLTVVDSENLNSSVTKTIKVDIPPPPRVLTLISISTTPSSTYAGFAVNIDGTLKDINGSFLVNKPVVIYYTFPGVDSWSPISSGMTDANGRYSVQWIPSASGYFTIKAQWPGNTTHYSAYNTITLSSVPFQNQYVFSVESNSTISGLTVDSNSSELRFSVDGPSGTHGYARVVFAKNSVVNVADIKVYIDGEQTAHSIASSDDSCILTFNFTHSVHTIDVALGTVVPEFPSILAVAVLFAVTLFAVILRKKHSREYQNSPQEAD